MSTATITFEIDGQQVAARDASWYAIAPCGCASGVTVVTLPAPYDITPRLTEDDAWNAFYEGRREEMRRDKASGHRMELGRRGDVVERMTDCPHEPKWGHVEVPLPDGYTWAAVHGSTRTHLVPGVKDEHARYLHGTTFNEAWDAGKITALCGKSEHMWTTHWADADYPTCRRCETKAAKS